MVPVTKSFIPPIDEYKAIVKRAFDNGWLTNRGELVVELENSLCDYLNLKSTRILCTNNGTSPLQIALKLLGNGGEIITTPFSYVATTSSIVWENCTPVFVDIEEDFLTINSEKIEASITDKTTCILATHVYGNPCNIGEIDAVAKKYNLKVIYDAAHCFGVKYKGKSIFEYGDISTCSFHATKLFHTGEGGAIFCNNENLFQDIYNSHNFGHDGPLSFHGLGINAKMSELNAAMGLTVLPFIEEIIEERKRCVEQYISNLKADYLSMLEIREETNWNFSYFPVIFESEKLLLTFEEELKANSIFPRRYFYPSLNHLPYVADNENLYTAENIARRVLCLPLYHDLSNEEVNRICQIILNSSKL